MASSRGNSSTASDEFHVDRRSQEMLESLWHSGTLTFCGSPLLAIQALGLDLDELVIHERGLDDHSYAGSLACDLNHGPFLDVLSLKAVQSLEGLREGNDERSMRLRGKGLVAQFLSTYTSAI